MVTVTIVCARCTLANHVSQRFCSSCGLPLGALQPDAEAAYDALEPYEAPEPADPDVARLIIEFRQADRLRREFLGTRLADRRSHEARSQAGSLRGTGRNRRRGKGDFVLGLGLRAG